MGDDRLPCTVHQLTLFIKRWGQIYILDALLRYVPETHADAELLGERISVQLQHANSAVVLTTIKVLLYLMNYMDNKKLVDHICKKMGPPLGTRVSLLPFCLLTVLWLSSNTAVLGTGGSVCRSAEHPAHNSETANCPQE